jgi:hypothetical protein
MLRRAAGSEVVALCALTLLSCLDTNTRSLSAVNAPSSLSLLALGAWQFGYGLLTKKTLRLAFGGVTYMILVVREIEMRWVLVDDTSLVIQLGIVWMWLLPLYCGDQVAKWMRAAGPVLISFSATWFVIVEPGAWRAAPSWITALTVTALAGISLLYWARFHERWFALTAVWAGAMASIPWTNSILSLLQEAQLRRGLTWYAVGCQVLAGALLVSLWKAGVIQRLWGRFQHAAVMPQNRGVQRE